MTIKKLGRNFSNVLILLILCSSVKSYAESCSLVSKKNNIDSVAIHEPGRYCLKEDIKLEKYLVLSEGRYKGAGHVLDIGQNVDLDFMQYVVEHDSKYASGLVLGKKNITIKNGSLEIKGKYSDGVRNSSHGSSFFKVKDSASGESYACYMTYPKCGDVSYLKTESNVPPAYSDTYITINNMNIHTSYRGIELGGNNNVIRNSTIEVDDNNAILLLGQYPIVENNTIIIHSKKIVNSEYRKKWNLIPQDGAIKLRDAKGGIIRNNKIIYTGGFFNWGKAPVAINLLDSKDVLIEGNTIEGFDKIVRENGDTSYMEKNNTIK